MEFHYKIPKWDSLRLEIHADRVTNNSHIGQQIYKVDKESGIVIDGDDSPLIEMAISKNDNGIKYRFAKYDARVGVEVEPRYQILVNAKMLGVKYFEGISDKNIREVYDYLISKDILHFSYDDFLDAKVFDIDCAYDFYCSADLLHALCVRIKNSVQPSMEKYINQFTNRSNNVGIQFNNRGAATKTFPFCKIYHKGLDLDFNSYDFNNHFIKRNGLKIGRYEFTFKNSKDFEYYGLEVKTLRDLLNVGTGKMKDMVLNNISRFYLEKRKRMRNTDKLGPKAFYEKFLIDFAIQQGMGREWFLSCVNDFKEYTDDVEYSQVQRLKRYIEQSLSDELWSKKLEENDSVDELFRDFV